MSTLTRGPRSADNFTRLPNSTVRDRSLTYTAGGLLAELLSHKEGWTVRFDDLVRTGRGSVRQIRAALHELEQAGYLERKAKRSVTTGRWSGYDWTINETPADRPSDAVNTVPPAETAQTPSSHRVDSVGPTDAVTPSTSEDPRKVPTEHHSEVGSSNDDGSSTSTRARGGTPVVVDPQTEEKPQTVTAGRTASFADVTTVLRKTQLRDDPGNRAQIARRLAAGWTVDLLVRVLDGWPERVESPAGWLAGKLAKLPVQPPENPTELAYEPPTSPAMSQDMSQPETDWERQERHAAYQQVNVPVAGSRIREALEARAAEGDENAAAWLRDRDHRRAKAAEPPMTGEQTAELRERALASFREALQ